MLTFKQYLIQEKKRVKKTLSKVKTSKYSTKEGIFEKSAKAIASYLLKKNKSKALSRIAFYINRAGKNLKGSDKSRLESAKRMIEKKLKK